MSAAAYEIRDAFTGETIEARDTRPTRAEVIDAARVSDTGAAAVYVHSGDPRGAGWTFREGYEDDGSPLR